MKKKITQTSILGVAVCCMQILFRCIVSNRNAAGSFVVFTTSGSGEKRDRKVVFFSEGVDLYHRELKFINPTHFEFTGTFDIKLYDETTDGPLTEEQSKAFPVKTRESYSVSSVGKIIKD